MSTQKNHEDTKTPSGVDLLVLHVVFAFVHQERCIERSDEREANDDPERDEKGQNTTQHDVLTAGVWEWEVVGCDATPSGHVVVNGRVQQL